MNKKKGNGIIIIGLLLIMAAAVLTAKNIAEDRKATQASYELLKQFEQSLAENAQTEEEPLPETDPEKDIPAEQEAEKIEEIDEEEFKGNEYGILGVLSIPTLKIELPVLAAWSYDGLEIAPCRYTGNAKTHDLVICAHNFPGHFGKLKNLKQGNTVKFTDWKGNIFNYTVDVSEELPPTAIDDVVESEWDLCLFTCTVGGRTRFVVRCNSVK